MEETKKSHIANLRIAYLDGFRGIAILLVAMFHAFARWPDLVPYGNQYSQFVLARYGWEGVELFFMISGFVIYLTLEKSSSVVHFLIKRWLRLFPGMLAVTLIVFATARFFSERPSGIPKVSHLIPGLLFIDPVWISRVFGNDQGVLEGGFWTLFVEVKFYIFIGLAYFLTGKKWAKLLLFAVFMVSFTGMLAGHSGNSGLHYYFIRLDHYLSIEYFGWFLIGVLVYELSKNPRHIGLLISVIALSILVLMRFTDVELNKDMLFPAGLILLFVGAVYLPWVRNLFASKVLVFLGFVSYPFYMLHENLLIAMLRKIGHRLDPLPGFLLPVLPILIIIGVAYIVARFIEPPLKKGLTNLLAGARSSLDRLFKKSDNSLDSNSPD